MGLGETIAKYAELIQAGFFLEHGIVCRTKVVVAGLIPNDAGYPATFRFSNQINPSDLRLT